MKKELFVRPTILKWAVIILLLIVTGCEKGEQIEPVYEPGCPIATISGPGNMTHYYVDDPAHLNALGDLTLVAFDVSPGQEAFMYVITDGDHIILEVSESNELNLKNLGIDDIPIGKGLFYVYAFSYKGEILAEPGENITNSVLGSQCFQLTSNRVVIDCRLQILKRYAPYFKFHPDEKHWPSSVDWSFQYLIRLFEEDENCYSGGYYYLKTKDHFSVGDPTAFQIEHFAGNEDFISEYTPVYAFLVERRQADILDLVYFIYYPWHNGKEILTGDRLGRHVGDWEHVVVRLKQNDGKFFPVKVFYSTDIKIFDYQWHDVSFYQEEDSLHPVVYVAKWSHGNWRQAGAHDYFLNGDGGLLVTDYCSPNSPVTWESWTSLEAYDFKRKEGLSGRDWPLWMGNDFADPGIGNPEDPASGPIYRWGNIIRQVNFSDNIWKLDRGPTGPISNPVLHSSVWKSEP